MYKCLPPENNELNQFFPDKNISQQPAFMRCYNTRDSFNKPILDRQVPFCVNLNNNPKCPDIIYPNGNGNILQKMKNSDIESELQGLNRRRNKCYDNDYIVKPIINGQGNPNSPLGCHANIFRINETQFHRRSEQGSLLDRTMAPTKCIHHGSFPVATDLPPALKHTRLYHFGEPADGVHYPPQKLFHNMTKRKMAFTAPNPQDLNKRFVTADCQALLNKEKNGINSGQFFHEDLNCMPYSITSEMDSYVDQCKPSSTKLRYW